MQQCEKIKIWGCLIALYLIWGSTFISMKFAIESFPPFQMAALRFLLAGGLMYAVLRWRGESRPNFRQWLGAAAVGTLLLAAGNGGVAYAQQWIASGTAALAIATVPLWTAVFSRLWGHHPTRREWTGIGLGMFGIFLLNLGSNMQANALGAAIILLAAVCWAFGSVWSQHLPMPAGPMAGAAQMLCGGAVLVLVSIMHGEILPSALPTPRAVAAMLFLVFFGSFLAYSAYLYLFKTVRPALATSYAFVNPLVAMLLGAWLAGESVGFYEGLALVVVLGGVLLVLSENSSQQQ